MLEVVPAEEGFRTLIDRLPIGLVWLDRSGEWKDWNESADAVLHTQAASKVKDTVKRLCAAAFQSHTCVETAVELQPGERMTVAVAVDRSGAGFVAVLDRRRLERARAEVGALHSFVRALAQPRSKEDAIRRALVAAREALPLVHLACFTPGPGRTLSCVSSVGISEADLAPVRSIDLDGQDNLLTLACKYARLIHVADVANAPAPVPSFVSRGLSIVALPVGQGQAHGVLAVTAAKGALQDGTLRVIEALADTLGAMLGMAVIEADVARARAVASQQERLATIGQLVAGVAHEINNPLAFLKSNLHSLKSDLADLEGVAPKAVLEDAGAIVTESLDGVARIEVLVHALKGTARQRHEHVRFDVARAVTEAVTIFRGAKKSEVEISADVAELPPVIGSASGLGQVVLNLLQNGLDAMSSKPRGTRKLEVSAKAAGGLVTIGVRDEGSGIPVEVQAHMFDAFFTTKEQGKGTGLGLAICKEIVEGMGGRIECDTGEEGTEFRLQLPADEGDDDAGLGLRRADS